MWNLTVVGLGNRELNPILLKYIPGLCKVNLKVKQKIYFLCNSEVTNV
jgi:hypothetical protein